ncbi:phytoene desaturase family protein [Micropruina sp.]|uniref:phytoene desaturase family protein n=1 Tax=Micropruina sp. TaxID=2737536 RepID=UPI0039E50002
MSRVIVIGAGLSGLSAACHLVADGHDVVVLERESFPGGRNGVRRTDGFTFDTGPTVLTMPALLEHPLRRIGGSLEPLRLRRLDPGYRGFFADGSRIDVRASADAMRAEIAEQVSAADAAAFADFVGWLEQLHEVELPNFIARNFDSPLDLLSRPGAAAKLVRLGGFGRLGPTIRRRFSDDRLVRLFTFQAMYAGLAPDDALALYAVITYMDSISGVWFPADGMHAVPLTLAAALEAAGAELRYEAAAEQILTDGQGRVAGVRAGGEQLAADAVVLTADLPTAYRTLLPDLTPPRAARSGDFSPSAVVWHLGVRGSAPAKAAHHNIHFGHAWGRAFEQLIKRKELMSDPSRLVTIPTVDAPAMAPEGHSVLYVLEPVPNLTGGQDWSAEGPRLRERLLAFLQRHGYPTEIVTELMVTPADWAAQGMAAGTPFSLAHSFAQTGPFRPPNLERRRPGVFLAGTGTTPGVGIPMVLISGELAARRVRDYLGAVR